MRAEEFIIENNQDNTFADGILKLTRHLQIRSKQRGISMNKIVQALHRLENLRDKDLRRLPPTTFVVKTPYDFEMAIIKRQDINTKKIEYVVATVANRLKPSAGQRIVYLENKGE